MPEQQLPPQDDPITSKSYALHYLIAVVLLMATLFWALWDEAYGQRPWKRYQEVFKERYGAYLKQVKSQSAATEKDVKATPEYQQLQAAYQQALDQAKPQVEQINQQREENEAKLAAVQSVFTDAKARNDADTYGVETSDAGPQQKQKMRDELEKGRQEKKYRLQLPGETQAKTYSYDELADLYNDTRLEKAALVTKLAEVMKPVKEAQTKADDYVSQRLVTLSPQQIAGVQRKYEDWEPQILQINVAEANIVDRCESCHLATRETVAPTLASMTVKGMKPDEYARAFIGHPDKPLLAIHDPEKFGCSPCHGGNGRATTSVEKAHGHYEHWLWPLYAKENEQTGCQTCHAADMVLASDSADVINEGKDLFRQRGCVGCHRYEGYDAEPEQLVNVRQQIKLLEEQQADNLRQAARLTQQGDQASSNDEAKRLYQQAENLKVANSGIAGRIEQYELLSRSLMRDQKKVGPDLKEIREKLNKNWIPVWLHKPTDFRATTKMPNFRLEDDEIQAITAYLWQTALTDPIPHYPMGNAAHGKALFESRGCMACHSVNGVGGTFAADLSREGEKANYDYLVRWVHNPRERTRPYCPYEKKDIGPEDYAKHGLPYVFDAEHSTCPNDGHELQAQQMTVMPVLRLSSQDAQDVASYLITLKSKEPGAYPNAAFMDDPKLKEKGKMWIRQYGCAGCHEIAGFEDEGRIGTELTAEGSKPLERLDFALLTHTAELGGEPITDPVDRARLPEGPALKPWYDNKGFFEHKLAEPNIYDQGMIKGDLEELRMPNAHLQPEQIRALVTFLLGSQDTSLPASYMYKPGDAQRDIQEGWWIIRKYNCMACHQILPGQATVLETLPAYQGAHENLPPKLLTEGARVDPEWLLKFLSNPSLTEGDNNRNGVRPYLAVRMPTFNFSPNELRKLVRFFQALSQQPQPYIPQPQVPLSTRETEMARSLFSSPGAPCLKCHATGDAGHDQHATAPNFLLAKERLKPGWAERWIIDPQSISPGTSMPSGLFRQDNGHWVFNGPTPPSFQGYDQDQTKLLVRYIFQLTAEEQRRISSQMPRGAPAKSGRSRAPATGPATGSGGSR
jgi:cytochrome c551/c552